MSQRVFGINELLCNNCGLTFNGFAVPGSIKREPSRKKERAGNKQQAPRIKTQVPVSLNVVGADSWSGGETLSPALEGYTRDISKIGLAVVVSDYRYMGHDFTDTRRRLLITADLPNGSIQLRAAPVRLERLQPQTVDADWLIGIRIVKMADRDCAHWIAYINSLSENSQSLNSRTA
ncbi:MAG TPA: PilZ domain-containing protein [Blastocatellia bacterium]|nr:PilZ domain-containing protein [Blastocatellia bacterium]